MRVLIRLAVALAAAIIPLAVHAQQPKPKPRPGEALQLTATAYCHDGTTKSGTHTKTGIAAADPVVLPVGSVVRVYAPGGPFYAGIYTVMDTGRAVKGRDIDLFIPNCSRAEEFGRKPVRIRVLRKGWSPAASAPAESDGR